MESTHINYSYKQYTLIVICAFFLALIIPKLTYSLRYSEFKNIWQIGIKTTIVLHGFSILFSFINSLFTFLEFRETKKWNLLWLILSLLPILYWSFILI